MEAMEIGYWIREFSLFLAENDPDHIWSIFALKSMIKEIFAMFVVVVCSLQGKKVDSKF